MPKKKIKPTTCRLDLAWKSKRKVIPDNMAPKSYLLPFVENYYSDPQYEFGDQSEGIKNLSLEKGFITHFWNGASQEIKVKLKESWLLKFYQVKQQKENSTENSDEKNFKEDLQFNELWNILTKQKRKEKHSNSKNLLSQTLSQISSGKWH